MKECNYEELIRTESEALAARVFGMEYCELSIRDRCHIREAAIRRLGLDAVFSEKPLMEAA